MKVELKTAPSLIKNFTHGKTDAEKSNKDLWARITTDPKAAYPVQGGRKVQMIWMALNPAGYVAQLAGREYADDSEVATAINTANKFATIAKWPSTEQRNTVKRVLSEAIAAAEAEAKKPAAKKGKVA